MYVTYRSLSVVPDRVWCLNIDPHEGSGLLVMILMLHDDTWWDQVDSKCLIISANEIRELAEWYRKFPGTSIFGRMLLIEVYIYHSLVIHYCD